MNKYKVSIINPSYNRKNLLKLTLDSIINQTINNDDFETIIIDDGSTDNSHDLIDEYSKKINIKYIYHFHSGAAKSRNIGILNSEGEICFFVDCGILLSQNALNRVIYAHKGNENIAVLGYLYGFDEYSENTDKILNLNLNWSDVNSCIDIIKEIDLLDPREKMYSEFGENLNNWPAPWTIFWVGYSSISKKNLIEVGMFDESFVTWGGEDIDLGISLFKNNIKFVLDRKLCGIHYPHEKFKSTLSNKESQNYVKKLKAYIHKKHNLESTKLFIDYNRYTLNKFLLAKGEC
ncbi:glycosyltransferase like 2 family protein [Clostridium sporogenes]|uniref:glycosyltransferase n=1 Tax=Clostridium TaxID=1485 RepID=UPI00090BC3BD|nr:MULTISPECIES: glycosyltransferase [Clostridium]APF25697.1 glycosyltransferase like 2 family protein [Clostridium sporogenes]MDI6918517.1 glycosyltransferase [Clostridium botulinum]WMU96461.1 glycosyltransferase [Clostridium botulinum]